MKHKFLFSKKHSQGVKKKKKKPLSYLCQSANPGNKAEKLLQEQDKASGQFQMKCGILRGAAHAKERTHETA